MTSPQPQPLDSNAVLLDVRLNQLQLVDSLNAFQFGQKIYLPLGEMARLMTIAVQVQPGTGTARGYIRRENQTFSLNVSLGKISLANVDSSFNRTDLIVQEDDIYVESSLLAEWLLVDFEINLSSLSVKLLPREPLPLQLRLEREAALAQRSGNGPARELNYPKVDNPYKLIDVPFIDQTMIAGARRGNGVHENTASYTTYIRGDLAGLQASAFLTGTNEQNSRQNRLTLGRTSSQADLFGPLKATSFAVGNVVVPGVANISRTSDAGNGIFVGNTPLDRPTRFNSHTLQGDLPPGWDVELYFNDALIAFQQSRPDGRYSFNDLNLVYGANDFRLVFHGPQGQLRTEKQSFLLDETLTAPGSFFYNVAAHKDVNGLQRSAATGEWGLSKSLTGSGGLVNTQALDGKTTQYTSAGLRGFSGNAVYSGNLTQQSSGGTLTELNVRTRVAAVTVGAGRLMLRNFTSEAFPLLGDPISYRDRIRLDGLVPGGPAGTLPVTVEVQRDKLQSGGNVLNATTLVSSSFRTASVSNLLHLASSPGARSVDGTFQLGTSAGLFRLRGQLNYLVKPQAEISALALAVDRSLGSGYQVNVGVTRTFNNPEVRWTSSLNKSLGSYAWALSGGYSSTGEVSVGVLFSIGIGREPRRPEWVLDAVPMAESGAVSARVFVDRNANGVMDDGEEPVKNVGFNINSSNHPARTDNAGIAYVAHLSSYRNIDIAINPATLEDPQLTSKIKGVRVTPRSGNVITLDFPLVLTGEIDGTVFLTNNGRKRGVGNVAIELLDKAGKVIQTTRSGSDGFFVLVEVPPGEYQMRIGEEQLNDLNLRYAGARKITMSAQGTFINGQDFSLEKR